VDALAAEGGTGQPSDPSATGPLVSVIIPTFNSRDLLAEALDAVAAQSLPPEAIEVIVVDDGSADGTWEMLGELQQTRPNLRAFWQENSGRPSVSRNHGLRHATGRYLFFNDADDYLAPDALRRLVTFADEAGSDVVMGRVRRTGQASAPSPSRGTVADADVVRDRIWRSLAPMKLFRRALVERLGLVFCEDMVQGEDQVFVASCLFAAARVSVLRDYDYYYRRTREDNQNLSLRPQTLTNKLLTISRMTALVVANTAPGKRRERLLTRVLIGTLGPALSHPFVAADAEERRHFLEVVQAEAAPHLTARMLQQADPVRRLRLLVAGVGTVEDVVEVNQVLRRGLRYCLHDGALAYDLGTHLNELVEPAARAAGGRLALRNRLLAVHPVRSGFRLSVDADLVGLPVDTVELVARRRTSKAALVLDAVPAGNGGLTLRIRPLRLWAASRRGRTASLDGRWKLTLRARSGSVVVASSRISGQHLKTGPSRRRAVRYRGRLVRATLRSGPRGMLLTFVGPGQRARQVTKRARRRARALVRPLLPAR